MRELKQLFAHSAVTKTRRPNLNKIMETCRSNELRNQTAVSLSKREEMKNVFIKFKNVFEKEDLKYKPSINFNFEEMPSNALP